MKWDNTQRLIDSSFELTMLAIKYCGNLCIVNNKGEETPLDRKRPKQLDKNDVKFAYDLCMSLNTDSVVNEIESHLTGDYDNNKLIFKVFFGKIAKRCNCLPLLFGASDWNVKAPKDWMKIGGWEQYMTSCKDIKMFVWLIAVCLRDKFDYLIREVQSLADTYDLVFDESDSEESEIETITVAKNKKSQTFSDIIQYHDKERLLKRFHELIDGRKGADAGSVILKAFIENYITRLPTQKEYESEFNRIGSWTAIHNYMNEDNRNALYRANRIVFFS